MGDVSIASMLYEVQCQLIPGWCIMLVSADLDTGLELHPMETKVESMLRQLPAAGKVATFEFPLTDSQACTCLEMVCYASISGSRYRIRTTTCKIIEDTSLSAGR